MLKARAKPGIGTIFAFGGIPFTKEWRDVPAGCEAEALRHPNLETEEMKPLESGAPIETVDEPAFEDVFASKAAYQAFMESGLTVDFIDGTGKDGKITAGDVKRALANSEDENPESGGE